MPTLTVTSDRLRSGWASANSEATIAACPRPTMCAFSMSRRSSTARASSTRSAMPTGRSVGSGRRKITTRWSRLKSRSWRA
jgi:hypothetical protein